MRVFLASTEDPASRNIRNRLLEEEEWGTVGNYQGYEVLRNDDILLYEKEGTHLYFDHVDEEISSHIRKHLPDLLGSNVLSPIDYMVFLSRHSSSMDVRSLTVHPPGNYLRANFGGEPGKLPPSAPIEMTAALKALHREKKRMGIKDQTTYEVTHHGPLISSPSFFIEIGSNERRWKIPELARAIAKTLLSPDLRHPRADLPIAIGIGGGHYAPRFTDRAIRNKFAFGHMIPDHVLMDADDIGSVIRMAKEATPGVEYAFLHRSGRNEGIMERVAHIVEDLGLKEVH